MLGVLEINGPERVTKEKKSWSPVPRQKSLADAKHPRDLFNRVRAKCQLSRGRNDDRVAKATNEIRAALICIAIREISMEIYPAPDLL